MTKNDSTLQMCYLVRLSGIDSSMTFQSEHTIGGKQHSNYLRVDQTLEFRGIDIVCVMVISSRVTFEDLEKIAQG